MPRVEDDETARWVRQAKTADKLCRPGCAACGGSGINSKGGACYPCQMTGRSKDKPPKETKR